MKVFYRPEQTARNISTFSPSAEKPAQVVRDWLERGLIQESDVLSYEPVTRTDLKRAHDAAFVDGVLDLSIDNGFGNRNAQVAASLCPTPAAHCWQPPAMRSSTEKTSALLPVVFTMLGMTRRRAFVPSTG